ncbi:hypothetical protein [Peptostreptococcus porci]|uniref:hypothetical protein n=1 Tax=Peptostreptococcus porci TaxID=2652282 RepID=UPI0023F42A43|nr:hypothetical protein [Peptostreptococcus porci]MDD7183354.1 hypothetical protein [Peptostreptococcus porci]MDY4127572.1 hypothetical protein [Peptostreptococcus porci]MDY5964760.1 hypothetical protein [Peptostreptococcus porci]
MSSIKIKKKNNQYLAFEDESSKKRCENVCKYIINNWEGIVNRLYVRSTRKLYRGSKKSCNIRTI